MHFEFWPVLAHFEHRLTFGLIHPATRALLCRERRIAMYQQTIREMAAALGYVGINPRHVEAWMRIEHSTLDWMDRNRFRDEVEIAIACIRHAGPDKSESLAQSYGL